MMKLLGHPGRCRREIRDRADARGELPPTHAAELAHPLLHLRARLISPRLGFCAGLLDFAPCPRWPARVAIVGNWNSVVIGMSLPKCSMSPLFTCTRRS